MCWLSRLRQEGQILDYGGKSKSHLEMSIDIIERRVQMAFVTCTVRRIAIPVVITATAFSASVSYSCHRK